MRVRILLLILLLSMFHGISHAEDGYQLWMGYKKINNVWTDVWSLRDMTTDEKLAKQQLVIDNWNLNVDKANYASWVFNSQTCEYIPPFPPPSDGKNYYWIEANGWVEVPEYPSDGSIYNLDKTTLTWVVATN